MMFVLFTLAYPLCADTSRISKWAAVVCTRSESSLGQGVCRGGEGGQDGTPGHHRGPRGFCAHQGYPGRLAPGSVQPVVRAAHGVDADLTEPADSVPQFGQSDRSRHAGGGVQALCAPPRPARCRASVPASVLLVGRSIANSYMCSEWGLGVIEKEAVPATLPLVTASLIPGQRGRCSRRGCSCYLKDGAPPLNEHVRPQVAQFPANRCHTSFPVPTIWRRGLALPLVIMKALASGHRARPARTIAPCARA